MQEVVTRIHPQKMGEVTTLLYFSPPHRTTHAARSLHRVVGVVQLLNNSLRRHRSAQAAPR